MMTQMAILMVWLFMQTASQAVQPPARKWVEEDHLTTRHGTVVLETGDDDGEPGWRVTFKGTVVAEVELDELRLSELFEGDDGRDYVVFRRASGGIACPYQFRVIEVGPAARTVVSEEFGSCLEPKRTRLFGDAVVFDMDMHIPHPELLSAAELRINRRTTEIYTVRRGKVTKRLETHR